MTKDELIKARDSLDEIGEAGSIYEVYGGSKYLRQALDAQIKACDVPKIEGLGEAIHDLELLFEDIPLTPYGFELYEPVLQAARAYHKQTGGDE
jgi:hypothetical protein